MNAQRAKIFIEDTIKKKNAKKLKRLNQRRRFNEAKAQLEQKVRNGEQGAASNNNSNENEDEDETAQEEAEFADMREEEMIYFDEWNSNRYKKTSFFLLLTM